MLSLLDMTRDELNTYLESLGQPKYRAKQLFSWLHKGASLDEMTNLPSALKEQISNTAVIGGVQIKQVFTSSDGTKKFLFELHDGNIIEGVLMKYKYGNTVCISTQVGCRMSCKFCASTLNGLIRNLTAGEIVGQVIAVNRFLGFGQRNITNIVLMGSGEPFDNYDNVIKFLELVHDTDGLGISYRNISISTCGLTEQIKKLADSCYHVTLSVSLHAPNDTIRTEIMPTAKRYSIEEILNAARYYVEKTGRRIIFEYALIDAINDTKACAFELAALTRNLQCHINLIPLNTVKERNLFASKKSSIEDFVKILESKGTSCSIRREMGADISGACGQLRAGYLRGDNNA